MGMCVLWVLGGGEFGTRCCVALLYPCIELTVRIVFLFLVLA